jgi:hypothetical protein
MNGSQARNLLVGASFSTFDHRGFPTNCNRSIDDQQRGGKQHNNKKL